MNSYEMNLKFNELSNELSDLRNVLSQVLLNVRPDDELWDNADIIKNWKVSERTLADWRKKGLISYVQVQSKIWYPRESRESFLDENYVKVQHNDRRARS
jgi:hypothetical protein